MIIFFTYVINRPQIKQEFNGGPVGCPSGLNLVIGALTDLKPVTSEKKNQNFFLQISKKICVQFMTI